MSKILMLLFAFIFLASSSVVMFMPVQAASEDSWASKTSMSTERRNFGVVVVNGKIYAVGGVDGVNETYDPKTDTWTTKEPMPTARSNLGIAVVQDKIYTIGGDDTGLNEVYDSTTDQWTAKTAMSTPRSGLNPHAIEGKIYVIGGMFSGANADAAVFYDINEVYDPKTDTWRTGTPIPTIVGNSEAGATTGVSAPKKSTL
jgi:N-acetylneuraminic acid mutarotase